MGITRNEKVNIVLSASVTESSRRAIVKNVKDALRTSALIDGDKVIIDYSFDIEYWNHVDEHFQAVLTLLECPDISVKAASYAELRHGSILLKQLLEKLDSITVGDISE